ncbi:MAG TPA: trypsin-like peptidase domain-containing protein [Tahibacter sp.]|nr:trypsin-like peptidase domain-containing protein [Tahibacter sp.]
MNVFDWARALGVLLGVAAMTAPCMAAGVYKWVDEKGNVHFSDKPPPGADKAAQGSVKQVELQNPYGDMTVSTKVPIRNARGDGGPGLALMQFTLQLDAANSRNVTVGRAFYGRNCEQSADLLWNEGMVDLKDRKGAQMIAERFDRAGYSLAYGNGAGLAEYGLDVELVKLKFDTCATQHVSGGRGTRAYVKLRWTMKGGASAEPLFRGYSEGAYDGWHIGDDRAIEKAFVHATDNLLGDRAFAEALAGGAPRAVKASMPVEPVGVTISRGDGAGTFRDRSERLIAGSVTVQTARGHGSGVVIDPAGFALTNAHVVGTETEVHVLIDGKTLPARVVRRDTAADVALLSFRADALRSVTLARNEPRPGDPLYVIGTPLSLKLSHTVTQGILSAVREERGKRLFQTDASINPGNSGGPVFDAAGELVALSVSGLVTAQGSSLNVNYLIPINRALAAMGIDAQ